MIYLITCGAWSDFGVGGLVEFTEAPDWPEIQRRWNEKNGPSGGTLYTLPEHFVKWLVRPEPEGGGAMPVKYLECFVDEKPFGRVELVVS